MTQKFDMYFHRAGFDRPPNASIAFLQQADPVAQFAMQLLLAPGVMVVGEPDGEDSAGRAKAKAPEIRNLVGRAFDIAEAAFEAASERNLMVEIPTFDEIDAKAKERGDKN